MFSETSLLDSVILAQNLGTNQEGDKEANTSNSCVHDPHAAEGKGECLQYNLSLGFAEALNEFFGRSGEGGGDLFGQCGSDGCLQGCGLTTHHVLVDDSTQDNGHGCRELADEAEGCGSGSHVSGADISLQGYERSLEVGANTRTGDDLEDDDSGPGGVGLQVDEQAPSENHQEKTGDDELAVPASLLHEDTGTCGHDGEAEGHGEDVDTTHDGVCEEDGLEVDREVVST